MSSVAFGRSASRSSATSASAVSALPSIIESPAVARPFQHRGPSPPRRRELAQPPGRAGRVVAPLERRLELDGAEEQLAAGAVRLARERAAAGLLERGRSLARQLRRRGAVELGLQLGRVVEVVGPDLEQLLAGPLVQPLGEPRVELRRARPSSARRSATSRISMCLKRKALLADDRRPRLGEDEVAEQEVVEQRVDVEVRRDVLDRAAPEDAADHGAAVEQRLLLRRQVVDAGGDQRLERVGDPRRADVSPPLSSSIRIVSSTNSGLPSVFSSTSCRDVGRERVVREQRSSSSSLSSWRSGSSSIAVAAHPASAPAGANVEQLGPGEADEQERRLAHPGGEVLDQLEQRLLGPVDVLEDEHERLHVGELVGPGTGCPGDLLRAALAARRPRGRRRRARAGRRPPRPRSTCAASRPLRATGSSSEIPADDLTISASGQ